MKRALPWLILVVVLGGVCWAFPPIRFHSLRQMRAAEAGTEFSAKDFATAFWTETLLPACDGATDAAMVIEMIAADPKQVRQRFGRKVGLSSSYFLFLRGSALVVNVTADGIGLSLKPEGADADIVVSTDFVFGNAVRDGTGMLDASKHPNAQQFNDISAQLNAIVEKQVLPEFQRLATRGTRVQFAGCAEIADDDTDLKPIQLVPIHVKGE